tara:strand:+ start:7722 stop:9002 length:1281 start_codon:yes stop_codon:yes gene_type:complete
MIVMKLLIKKAKICYPGHKLHGKTQDVIVESGKIQCIASSLKNPGNYKEITSKNLHLSPGWLDLKANLGEPGFEERETLESGMKAAAAGGFTGVCVSPDVQPFSDNRSSIEFVSRAGEGKSVTLYPLGALSKGGKGEELAEMFDMHKSGLVGAVAFTDNKPIPNAKFQLLLQQYSQNFDGLIYSFPMNLDLAGKGNVSEGETSTYLGLKGIPHLAEEITVARDLQILEYAGGRLHFSDISSAESAKLIGASKKSKLNATASVAWYHLIFNDTVLEGFDSNYKVLPPLRTESDRKGLIKALKEGNIDTITSNHQPQNIERKECEFEYAGYGINGMQVVFAALNTFAKELDLDTLVESLGIRPYQVLNKETPSIEEGSNANFTLFDPQEKWTYDKTNNHSLAENNPMFGTEFTGKVLGTVNGKVGNIS